MCHYRISQNAQINDFNFQKILNTFFTLQYLLEADLLNTNLCENSEIQMLKAPVASLHNRQLCISQ
jgi:hypothetical protein